VYAIVLSGNCVCGVCCQTSHGYGGAMQQAVSAELVLTPAQIDLIKRRPRHELHVSR
jgi:hypothetical protein